MDQFVRKARQSLVGNLPFGVSFDQRSPFVGRMGNPLHQTGCAEPLDFLGYCPGGHEQSPKKVSGAPRVLSAGPTKGEKNSDLGCAETKSFLPPVVAHAIDNSTHPNEINRQQVIDRVEIGPLPRPASSRYPSRGRGQGPFWCVACWLGLFR